MSPKKKTVRKLPIILWYQIWYHRKSGIWGNRVLSKQNIQTTKINSRKGKTRYTHWNNEKVFKIYITKEATRIYDFKNGFYLKLKVRSFQFNLNSLRPQLKVEIYVIH